MAADNFTPVQTQKTQLSGSGVTSTATSIVLKSLKLPDDSTTITMGDFGDIGYATIEPGTSKEEQISFTGITQNGNGTATLTGVTRGLRFVDPYDEVAANKKSHAGGAVVVFSNTGGFYSELSARDNDETITGKYTFNTTPAITNAPVDGTDAVNKDYADGVATGNTSTNRVVISGNAGATVAAGDIVYQKDSDGEWYLADASTAASSENVLIGIAQGAGVDGGAIANGVLIAGTDSNQSGLTANTKYFLSDTAGDLSTTAGTVEVELGHSHPTDATKFILAARYDKYLTEDQQDLIEQIEAGTDWYAASAVGTDSYAITITPAITAYVAGMRFRFKTDVANTGAATLAVSGLAAKTIKKLNDQDLETGDIEAGQIIEVVYDGTNMQMVSQLATSAKADVQTFTGNGTWTKPTGAKYVDVYVIGAGGGGGSGSMYNTLASAAGGAGGGGGAYVYKRFLADALSSTETVTVGAGGAGGASQTSNNSNGNVGSAGGNSTFGTNLVKALGGSAGAAGTTGTASGGAGGATGHGIIYQDGGAGGNGGDDGVGADASNSTTIISPRGGGGGGGASAQDGGAGGGFATYYVQAGGTAGSASVGGNGATLAAGLLIGGPGGGGGAGARNSAAFAGGNGGYPGGGGGGGGSNFADSSTTSSGAGGTGGDGVVVVITYK